MSEFALRGVEQLLTSMHVEFAIDMRDVSLFRAIRYIQRFADIRPTTKNASVNRKNREAKLYRH